MKWEEINNHDIDQIDAIANLIHEGLPERKEVLAEKIALFPLGCRKLVLENNIVGYAISHPWKINDVPKLDNFLLKLPDCPNCIYLHDIALLPEGRGGEASHIFIKYLISLCKEEGFKAITCVSVYGTDTLWHKYGFKTVIDKDISEKINSYGTSAKYMIRAIDVFFS